WRRSRRNSPPCAKGRGRRCGSSSISISTTRPRASARSRRNSSRSSSRGSTTTPIGSLEAVLGRRALKPYLAAQAVDVAIIDVMYNGLLESVRMANLAEAHEVKVAGHGFAGPLATIISGHFSSIVPNLRILECDIDEVPWRPSLLSRPYRIEA